ncbi:hypothetical protein [Neorhizobium galegae]|jgi:hypothetical protein|uniref:Transmembrane protein n=1 Tax=Neorhizobium galegae bv. officinalis TaxID=323656 RepID=A0A0T7GWF9_NEOGA|nr:hypothetical protein [Neorhizobium galegae]CDZ51630.1 Hypothetical protein NGAL_HAMBI1189_40780 [Neorhizobium galegae bv. officinalis]
MARASGAVLWILAFSVAGFGIVKLAFMLVCVIGGHNLMEALFGLMASVVFGGVIGIESYLWFREWRLGRRGRSLDSHLPFD